MIGWIGKIDMKYDNNKICMYQSGTDTSYCSTLWRHIYEVGKYWIITDNGACGQSVHVFLKDEVKDQKKEIIINFSHPKNITRYTSGWYQYYESLEEAIDRNISEFEYPNQLVWYEKCQKQFFMGFADHLRIRFDIDSSEGNKKKIESSANFKHWVGSDGY